MEVLPYRRKLESRHAEAELGQLRRRFRTVTRRYERSLMIGRLLGWLRTCLIVAIVILVLLLALMLWAPKPLMALLDRAASLVN